MLRDVSVLETYSSLVFRTAAEFVSVFSIHLPSCQLNVPRCSDNRSSDTKNTINTAQDTYKLSISIIFVFLEETNVKLQFSQNEVSYTLQRPINRSLSECLDRGHRAVS